MKSFAYALAVAAVAIFAPCVRAQVMYTVTDIGLLPGEPAIAGWDVNNAGQVVGQAPGVSPPHNFFWSASTGMIDLGTFDQIRPRYVGINNNGQIRANNGPGGLASGGAVRGTVSGGFVDLGVLPGGSFSVAWGINDSGQVVGQADTASGQIVAFRTTANGGLSTATAFAPPISTGSSSAMDINASGQITGGATFTDPSIAHAFRIAPNGNLSDPGADLGTLGGPTSGGVAINPSGQVAGNSDTADGHTHAFRTTPTGNLSDPNADLGTLPGFGDTSALDINALGVVVGRVNHSGTGAHAMIDDATGMHDLNDLIPPGSGWFFSSAAAISDSGFITGTGTFNGSSRAFLLTPVGVPEPSTLLLTGTALVGGWLTRRGRRQRTK